MAVALAVTWAAAEHAGTGTQVPLAITSSTLHLLATAVWLGGLVAVLRAAPPAPVVSRFSRASLTCVTVLALTGTYQSWRGLGSWQALTRAPYGHLLLTKLAAVTALLGAAAYARRWTHPHPDAPPSMRTNALRRPATAITRAAAASTQAASPPPTADASPPPTASTDPPPTGAAPPGTDGPPPTPPPAGLRRSVLVETVVAALVLLLTTLLTTTPPGRTAGEAAQAAPAGGVLPASVTTIPFDAGPEGGGRGQVQVTLDPGRTGDNAVQAVVLGPDGGLAAVPELRLSFTLPDHRIGPVTADLVDRGGYWSANALTLPLPGTWTMKATVRVTETDQVSEARPVRIRP
ncbi:CopD family protein [Streptomyces sp. NPDC003717]|uniref:CopD family protein n=1 Tax=Streptomyces sp. NPDC003717 TaxID=3154276 RepID=UPI0033AB040F